MPDPLTVIHGNAAEQLRSLPSGSVHCCVTSPPYWGLRNYDHSDQLGVESSPEEYVANLVGIMREVRRVLRSDGTLWLNLGDSYASWRDSKQMPDTLRGDSTGTATTFSGNRNPETLRLAGLKHKDLCGIPWSVAFALRADGWYLRSDIIWFKPNPMPESVTDRPTKSHEYLFLLTPSVKYYYDYQAILEPAAYDGRIDTTVKPSDKYAGRNLVQGTQPQSLGRGLEQERWPNEIEGEPARNKRSVWRVPTVSFTGAHFATFPPDLIKPCIMAGTSARGCCAKCGAPWERIVKSVPSVSKDCPKTVDAHHARGGTGLPCGTVGQSGSGRVNGYSETLGWQPTCVCSDQVPFEIAFPTPVPCTVLDPFAGSGTTGAVALELGRKAVLIELNPNYIELIQQRCNITPGLPLA